MKKIFAFAMLCAVIIVSTVGNSAFAYASGSGTATGLFGFAHDEWFFVQALEDSGAHMGTEIASNTPPFGDATMTHFDMDGVSYIFCNASDGEYAITPILPTGDLGVPSDSGQLETYFTVVTSFQIDQKQYIMGQNDQGGWGIVEILPGGKLRPGYTSHGSWHPNVYDQLIAFQIDGIQYIMGHKESGYWFIQKVLPGGITHGTLQTDSGTWKYYYPTLVPYQIDGKQYIFGQKESGYWFIQEIHPGGKTCQGDEKDHGTWGKYYEFVCPVLYDSRFPLNPSLWMTEIFDTIKDHPLKEIVMPGSHDSGMSSHPHCYLACACNTQTQVLDMKEQLNLGIRYIDFRPTWYAYLGGKNWYTGHFTKIHKGPIDTYAGCVGQTVNGALDNIRDYIYDIREANPENKELVIVSFSHCYNIERKRECDHDEWQELIYDIALPKLSEYMLNCESNNCNVLETPYGELIGDGGGNVIFRIGYDAVDNDYPQGIINAQEFPIYNHYSNTTHTHAMIVDQYEKLITPANHDNKLFLLSWTLTLTKHEAEWCMYNEKKRLILDYAMDAKRLLMPALAEWWEGGKINRSIVPNIIYTDDCKPVGSRAAAYLNISLHGESYKAELKSKSPEDELITISKGQTRELSVAFINTGTSPWNPDLVHLGTAAPPSYDRDTNLDTDDGNWISPTRIRMQGDRIIMPGDSARFTFNIRPNEGFTQQLSRQAFELVMDPWDGLVEPQWFGDGGRVEFFVLCLRHR